MEDLTSSLQTLGIELPTPAYLIGALLFSAIGFVAYRYGRKRDERRTLWLGVALMFYAYVVPWTWLMYVIGIGLCVAIWFDHR